MTAREIAMRRNTSLLFRPFAHAAAGGMLAALVLGLGLGPVDAADEAPTPPDVSWSFEGPFGTYDRAELQRGYQVYREVCAACHSMDLLSFRNLGQPGGPEFSADQVAAMAAQVEVTDGPDDTGEMFTRPGVPSDAFPAPFPNDQAARAANGGALPPDLSVIVKARPNGADYIHGLLVGYQDPPAGFELTPGMSYNLYFPGHQIAMPPPLNEGQVEYADGTEATVERMARDVTAFLAWAAEPKLEARHRLGFQVMIYLIVLAVLLYFSKRRIWARLGHA